jgi:hypothetical protein
LSSQFGFKVVRQAQGETKEERATASWLVRNELLAKTAVEHGHNGETKEWGSTPLVRDVGQMIVVYASTFQIEMCRSQPAARMIAWFAGEHVPHRL